MDVSIPQSIDIIIDLFIAGKIKPNITASEIRPLILKCPDYNLYALDSKLTDLIHNAKGQAQDHLLKRAYEALARLTEPMVLSQVPKAALLIHTVVISDLIIKLMQALKAQTRKESEDDILEELKIPATLQIMLEQFFL